MKIVRFTMYFQHLYPFPKSCVENRDVRFVFGASVQAVISGLSSIPSNGFIFLHLLKTNLCIL